MECSGGESVKLQHAFAGMFTRIGMKIQSTRSLWHLIITIHT